MDYDKSIEIENEMAREAIAMCGETGVLDMVNNEEIKDESVKLRHQQALDAANKFKDNDGHAIPEIQTIYARIYGLI